MIDIENQVFTQVKQAILADHPGVFIAGDYVDAPADFPCVNIMEMSNTALESTRDSSSNERHSVLMYEVNVYSTKSSGRKTEAKKLAQSADAAFQRLGFTRSMLAPIINAADTSVYRILGRYTAIVDKNEIIYRR